MPDAVQGDVARGSHQFDSHQLDSTSVNFVEGSQGSQMKMRMTGLRGDRVTMMKLDKDDPSSKEAFKLIQELDAKGNGEIDLVDVVKAMKEKQGLVQKVGRQRIIIVVILVLAAALFGLTLGTSVLGGSLIKETHIEQDRVLMAGDNVAEAAQAVQSVPLKYLPFMDASLVASIIGKSIKYTLPGTCTNNLTSRGGGVVHSNVVEVFKPANETLHEVHVHTRNAIIIVKPAEATLVVDGKELALCGEVSCSKVSLTMEADLHAIMERTLGKHAARRLLAAPCSGSGCATQYAGAAQCTSQGSYTLLEAYADSDVHGNACFDPNGQGRGFGDWRCPDGCTKGSGPHWCYVTGSSQPCRVPEQAQSLWLAGQVCGSCQAHVACQYRHNRKRCVNEPFTYGMGSWCGWCGDGTTSSSSHPLPAGPRHTGQDKIGLECKWDGAGCVALDTEKNDPNFSDRTKQISSQYLSN